MLRNSSNSLPYMVDAAVGVDRTGSRAGEPPRSDEAECYWTTVAYGITECAGSWELDWNGAWANHALGNWWIVDRMERPVVAAIDGSIDGTTVSPPLP